jgi:hypothetical protein
MLIFFPVLVILSAVILNDTLHLHQNILYHNLYRQILKNVLGWFENICQNIQTTMPFHNKLLNSSFSSFSINVIKRRIIDSPPSSENRFLTYIFVCKKSSQRQQLNLFKIIFLLPKSRLIIVYTYFFESTVQSQVF